MNIDWFHFIFALLLLWMPRQALRTGQFSKSRRAARHEPMKSREPGDSSVSFRTEFSKLRNYIDLFRAALGSVALLGGVEGIAPAVQAAGGAPMATVRLVQYGPLLILVIAVLIQSFRFEQRRGMFAPIFFLSGLSFGLCGVPVAGFALILIWSINLVLPNPATFLATYALLLVAFTTLFLGTKDKVPFAPAFLCFLPVLLSLLLGRPLVLFSKKVKPSGSSLAP